MNTSTLPQDLMTNSLVHFEKGVPIDDLQLRGDQKRRLARVEHVYWVWMRNPFLDVFHLFRQLVKGHFADPAAETRAAQKDKQLFDFIVDRLAPPSRRQDEQKVRAAADQMMRIGRETDNVMALDKGSKRLIEVAHLNEPESQQADMSKVMFIPAVVTTSAKEIDPTKEDQTDEQAKAIIDKYNAYVDDKRKAVDERVDAMLAARDAKRKENENQTE